MSSYQHVSLVERAQIKALRLQKVSLCEIGRQIGRSHTTISRELNRNSHPHPHLYGYVPELADRQAKTRKQKASQRLRLKNSKIRSYVHEKLAIGWTPEIIAGVISQDLSGHSICYEAIYQYIYVDYREGIALLPRKHKKRYPRQYIKKRRCPAIQNRIDIDKRPEAVNQRQVFGHWESDSIVAQKSVSAISVVHERISRKACINKLKSKAAKTTKTAIIKALKDFPPFARQSLTYDNGSENAEHEAVNKTLGCVSYFCKPYHSWEKGAVENTNGLIRRYIPKGTDLDTISEEHIKYIEAALNNRPRKCLGFKTPNQVFQALCARPPPIANH